jgi:hypothetical protein
MSNDISHLLIEALEKGEVGLSIKKGSVVAEHVLRAGVSSVRMPHALRDIRACRSRVACLTHGEWACLVEWPSHGEGPWI